MVDGCSPEHSSSWHEHSSDQHVKAISLDSVQSQTKQNFLSKITQKLILAKFVFEIKFQRGFPYIILFIDFPSRRLIFRLDLHLNLLFKGFKRDVLFMRKGIVRIFETTKQHFYNQKIYREYFFKWCNIVTTRLYTLSSP